MTGVQTCALPIWPVRGFSALEDAIDRLRASGRTALYAGVKEGGRQVERFYSDRREIGRASCRERV